MLLKSLATILAMSFSLSAFAQSATQMGDITFYSDGTSAIRMGDTTFFSDGSSATRMGDTTFYSNGSSATQIGDTTYFSDGQSATRIETTLITAMEMLQLKWATRRTSVKTSHASVTAIDLKNHFRLFHNYSSWNSRVCVVFGKRSLSFI